MTPWQWVSAATVGILALGIGAWWWVTRIPLDRRDSVSQIWRDEHSRERRD